MENLIHYIFNKISDISNKKMRLPLFSFFGKSSDVVNTTPFTCTLHKWKSVVLPPIKPLDRLCRDATVAMSFPPIGGKRYLCGNIINLEPTSELLQDREINVCEHDLRTLLQLVFPRHQHQVYVLYPINEDGTSGNNPIYVGNEGFVAHYLVDTWRTYVHCCNIIDS